MHDALKNATSTSSEALAANITELNRRLEEIFPVMQDFNQTRSIANLQSMLEEESIYRKGNDSILLALVNNSTVARQKSVRSYSLLAAFYYLNVCWSFLVRFDLEMT